MRVYMLKTAKSHKRIKENNSIGRETAHGLEDSTETLIFSKLNYKFTTFPVKISSQNLTASCYRNLG